MNKIKAIAKDKKNQRRAAKAVAISVASLVILATTGQYISPYIWIYSGAKAGVKAAVNKNKS